MAKSPAAPGPALRPQAPRGGAPMNLEDWRRPSGRGPQPAAWSGRCPPAGARRRQAGGCRDQRWGAERPAPSSGPSARRPPLSFLTSRSVLAARRNCGWCFFMIFRKVLRGAVRFILLLLFLLPLRPLTAENGPNGSRPTAVRIGRPGAGAHPPWRTSQRPGGAPPPGSAAGRGGGESSPLLPSPSSFPPLRVPPGRGAEAFPWKPHEMAVVRGEPYGASAPSRRGGKPRGNEAPSHLRLRPDSGRRRQPSQPAALPGHLGRAGPGPRPRPLPSGGGCGGPEDSGGRLKRHGPVAEVACVGRGEPPELVLGVRTGPRRTLAQPLPSQASCLSNRFPCKLTETVLALALTSYPNLHPGLV